MQTNTLNKENKMKKSILSFIATTAALEQEVSNLAAQKWAREAQLMDFESRTSSEKQLQQAYLVWKDYKEMVDAYDAKYALLIKHRTLLDSAKRFTEKLTEEDLAELFKTEE